MKRNTGCITFIALLSFVFIVFACASTQRPGTVAENETGGTAVPTHEAPEKGRESPQEVPWQVQEPVRIPPLEAYQKAKSGKALLVCAYEDETICEVMHLEGSIFLQQLEAKLPTLPKSQEIIFYCH